MRKMKTEAEVRAKMRQIEQAANQADEKTKSVLYPQVIVLLWVLEEQDALAEILGDDDE